jgi:hypothetical protein
MIFGGRLFWYKLELRVIDNLGARPELRIGRITTQVDTLYFSDMLINYWLYLNFLHSMYVFLT